MLTNELQAILKRLSAAGWREIFLQHDLDLAAADLATELARDPKVQRSAPGFEDFSLSGHRAIEPGDPALSLLYHGLASPLVRLGVAAKPGDYPTLAELDVLENYIYSLNRSNLMIGDLAVAVFAYEYRPANDCPHTAHADLVFSRTGIARNGTVDARYDPVLRCYVGIPANDSDCLVSPARYGVFLARRMS